MGLDFITKSISNNSTTSFDFGQPISAFCVGVSGFYFEYSDERHNVQNMSLALSANKVNSNTISVGLTEILNDDSNNHITSGAWAYVTVFAWLGSGTPAAAIMANSKGVPSGGTSAPIATGGQYIYNHNAFCSGFNYAVQDGDEKIISIGYSCGASVSSDGSNITTNGDANMVGDLQSINSLDIGLIAAIQSSPGFEVQTVQGSASDTTLTTTFPTTVRKACAVIQNFYASYGTDNNLWEFKVGAMSHDASTHTNSYSVTVSGNEVTLANQVYMVDNHSDHVATDTSVSYVVVALV